MGHFPGEKLWQRPYSAITKSGNKLYFSPWTSEAIGSYDLVTNTFEPIPYPAPSSVNASRKEYNKSKRFKSVINIKDTLYFIPSTYPGILEFNTKTREYKIIDDWIKPFNDIMHNIDRQYFSNGFYDQTKGCLVLPSTCANALVELDISTNKASVRQIEKDADGYRAVVSIDGNYWLLNREGTDLIRYNLSSGDSVEYKIPTNMYTADSGSPFQRIVHHEDNLYLLPFMSKWLLKFDLTASNFSIVNDIETEATAFNNQFTNIETNHILLSAAGKSLVIDFNPLTGENNSVSIELTDIVNLKEFHTYILNTIVSNIEHSNYCTIAESPFRITLEQVLDILSSHERPEWLTRLLAKQLNLRSEVITNPDGTAGSAIWQHCKTKIAHQ